MINTKDMKLELKHLAPYLPYGLKMQCRRHFIIYGEVHILPLNGISKNIDWQLELIKPNDDLAFIGINEKGFKPILRPLSDLTKEIEHNGEKFVPTKWLLENSHVFNYSKEDMETLIGMLLHVFSDVDALPQRVFNKLIEWKFDVFYLISNGLAIDINTLNK